MTDASTEFLSFEVAQHQYAAAIHSVREIRSWSQPTPLPHAPDYVQGVINLRGTVLPIIDLEARLGLYVATCKDVARPVIIIVQSGEETVGLKVDAVEDILTLAESELSRPPELTQNSDGKQGISALYLTQDSMIRILDIDWVFGAVGNQSN